MTAILDVIFPLTAAWEDDIKMAGKYFYLREERQSWKLQGIILKEWGSSEL